jgi:hypothetical protein
MVLNITTLVSPAGPSSLCRLSWPFKVNSGESQTKHFDARQIGKIPEAARTKLFACQMHRWFRAEFVPVEGEPL